MQRIPFRALVGAGLFILCISLGFRLYTSEPNGKRAAVDLVRTPQGGVQPQSAVDNEGAVHLIFFQGDPAAGDIFYVRRASEEDHWSKPIRVNSQPGSVIAMGTVRGAHLAIGKDGRVHVAWMGSGIAEPKGPSGVTPMLYARLNDNKTAFEPQRNVMQVAAGLDGGGSIAADPAGNVYVAWHARGDAEGEANRRVWLARSQDDGRTFAREVPAYAEPTGACGCCGMRAFADDRENVYVLYRTATKRVHRDMQLLISKDGGKHFEGMRLDQWEVEGCPMSTSSIRESGDHVVAAWQTEGQVFYAEIGADITQVLTAVAAPGKGENRKHPVAVGNNRGETLLVWTEDTGWNKGGTLAWQVFDETGKLTERRGEAQDVPVWSLPTAFANADGGFTIVY